MDVPQPTDDAPPGGGTPDAASALLRTIAEHAVRFSPEQDARLGDALFEAELALLQAIAHEAGRLESFDAARNIPRLVGALGGLRSCMGQQLSPRHLAIPGVAGGGWSAYAPGMDDDDDLFDD